MGAIDRVASRALLLSFVNRLLILNMYQRKHISDPLMRITLCTLTVVCVQLPPLLNFQTVLHCSNVSVHSSFTNSPSMQL